jgi:putative holliday junction resolvase
VATKQRKRILAIDYGAKRIGLAKTDPLQLFAQPVGTFDEEQLLHVLDDINHTEGIECIVLGYPLNADGTQNRMTGIVDAFAERLRQQFNSIPILFIDEHGSSKTAGRILAGSGLGRKKRTAKGRLDAAAACILLRQHLDSRQ